MMTTNATSSISPAPAHLSQGGRLVSAEGQTLPLLGTSIGLDAFGGIARVTLEQRFRNVHAEPLAVTYSLPLPADGAVSGFSFRIGAVRTVGAIDKRASARERYEAALIDGRSAAILEQDRSSLFTQEIGNIPPGEEVIVEVMVDQRLRWLDEGAWEWRFPTVVAPRFLGEDGRVADAARVTHDVAEGELDARFTIGCAIRDGLAQDRSPESPSHALKTKLGEGATRVELHEKAGARLDRDVVVRWMVATPKIGLTLDTGRASDDRGVRAAGKHTHGLLTVVPPAPKAERRAGVVPRDLIVLLDTSGSMSGEPIDQAVRVTTALVDTLRDHDRLELITFGDAPERWKKEAIIASAAARKEAVAWLRSRRASGGTEMRAGIMEALTGLRDDAQRQVVLITDGLIGFESQVVAAICDRLPKGSRVHTVGVGSAVNRSLTGPAARAGHGLEVIVGIGEDPERAASRLVARTAEPIVVDLVVEGSALVEHAPAKLPDLFAGAPALIALALRPEGGDLCVRGRTREGTWERRMKVPARAAGEGNAAVVALFGREAVEDLETRLAAGSDKREIDATIERIGLEHRIATRLTSWIAVTEERTVDPDDALRRERMPHELPYGMSAEGLGLRRPTTTAPMHAAPMTELGLLSLGAPAGMPMPAPMAMRPASPMRAHSERAKSAAYAGPPPPAQGAAPPAPATYSAPSNIAKPMSAPLPQAPSEMREQALLPRKNLRSRILGFLVLLLLALALVALIVFLLRR